MRAILGALATAVVLPAACVAQSCPPTPEPGQGSGPIVDVRYLADDALEGREVGTASGRCAAAYLAARFEALGLEPAGPEADWLQPFTLRIGSELVGTNELSLMGRTLALGSDWVPYGFAGSGTVAGSLVYGGTGVARPGVDEPVEVSGRVVVVEALTPEVGTLYSDPHFKGTIATRRGARAALILLPEGAHLPEVDGETRPFLSAPVVAVSGATASAVREAARNGADVVVRVGVRARAARVANVVALLPGSDPALRDEFIVIGAHFDHLGRGGEGSMEPGSRQVHNGADDNASGTAAVIEVARQLATGSRPARSILFVGFDGEERGLLGSAFYAANPVRPLVRTVAMLNLDMVGRLRENTLSVFGLATAEEWGGLLDSANAELDRPLDLVRIPDGFGSSDHASFYARGIPVLHFFTNTHEDYHRPSDDWEKVDAQGIERIASLVAVVTRHAAGGPGRAPITPVPVVADAAAPSGGPPNQGYGPYFGSIPDMTPIENGVRLTGVRAGSPADRAGVQAGDVLVEFAGEPVTDLYAFTYALRERAPGDVVMVTVLRDGARLTLRAVLGERR